MMRQYITILLLIIFSASFSIAQEINIIPNSSLSFGKVVKPAIGNAQITITKNGSLGNPSNAVILNSSSVSAGSQTIAGSTNNNVSISFSQCSSNSAIGLEIKNFVARYDTIDFVSFQVGLPPPSLGTNLLYGATLVINSNAQTGNLQPCYHIDVNYE